MPKPVVISLGGSMLFKQDDSIDFAYLRSFKEIVLDALARDPAVAVVVGGGKRASEYAQKARAATGSEFFADREAIKATRENAALLIKEMGVKAFSRVVTSPDEAAAVLEKDLVPICGGFLEGITTDACSVLVAERVGASAVVNVSHADGVYDKDPRGHADAKKFKSMKHAELSNLAYHHDNRLARTNFVFDLVACKLAQRSNITIHFVSGADFKQVEAAILGKAHDGTVVKD